MQFSFIGKETFEVTQVLGGSGGGGSKIVASHNKTGTFFFNFFFGIIHSCLFIFKQYNTYITFNLFPGGIGGGMEAKRGQNRLSIRKLFAVNGWKH